MASPQLENGHSRLANEILEAIMRRPPASVAARQIWDWVWRYSWGWKGAANTRPTSVRALAEAVGLSKTVTARALGSLLETNHVARNEDGSLSIQKDHERWVEATPGARRPPTQKQLFLLAEDPENCPHGGDKLSPRRGQKCPHGGDKSVPTAGTLTIRSVKKERKKEGAASGAAPIFSKPENDSPRRRAELGDPERPPEEHPNFGKLGFKRRDELTDQWKEAVAKRLCRTCRTRPKASVSWPYCRPCTVCARCRAVADGGRQFVTKRGEIVCTGCNAAKEDA